MDKVVDEYKRQPQHANDAQAARNNNRDVVKPNLDSIRKSDNPEAVINVEDDAGVIAKQTFGKIMCPTGRTSFARW